MGQQTELVESVGPDCFHDKMVMAQKQPGGAVVYQCLDCGYAWGVVGGVWQVLAVPEA